VHSIAEMIPEDQESKTRIVHDIRQALGRFISTWFQMIRTKFSRRWDRYGCAPMRWRARRENMATRRAWRFDSLTNALTQAQVKLKMADRAQLPVRLSDYEHHFYADLESQLAISPTSRTVR